MFCASDGSRCLECEGSAVTCDDDEEVRCSDGRRLSATCEFGCTLGVGCNALPGVGFLCNGQCQTGAVCQQDVGGQDRCCSRDCAAEGKECAANGSCVCPPGQLQGSSGNCLLQQGDPCTQTTQCAAGLTCVDGVCCDGACSAACERCNVAGSRGQCSYDAADSSQCPGGQVCAARGDCQVQNGGACTTGTDCLSNNCMQRVGGGAQICCAQACAGQTNSCSSNGGRCVQCESNATCGNGCNTQQGVCNPLRTLGDTCSVSSECGSGTCTLIPGTGTNRCCPQCNSGQVCNANGACVCPPNQILVGGQCRKLDGQQCTAGQDFECANGNCERAVDGRTLCCNDPCRAGIDLCSANGGACVDQRGAVGASCQTGADCINGSCIDGFCCNGPCNLECERCNAPGRQGQCSEDRGAACQGSRECFGRGECRATIGQTCNNVACGEGSCEDLVESANDICCGETCNARRPFCSADAIRCVQGDGATCTANADCASNNCNSGVCCGSACPPVTCAASNNPCVVVPATVTTNLCNSSGACRSAAEVCAGATTFAGANVSCDPQLDPLIRPGQCNGAGDCEAPEVVCGNSICSLSDRACCQHSVSTTPTFECLPYSLSNPANPTFATGCSFSLDRTISCDEPADCPSNTVCCSEDSQGGRQFECIPPNICGGVAVSTPICASPVSTSFPPCPSGLQCMALANAAGFSTCR